MICAIDCDLRTSYCVTSAGTAGRGATPLEAFTKARPAAGDLTLLFEIASPVSFNRGAAGHAAMTQLAKWAIWNAAQAMLLDRVFKSDGGPTLLVAPSNVWTRGYALKTRHAIASCTQPKKDLRECECMIFMYKQRPQDWKPLQEYLSCL